MTATCVICGKSFDKVRGTAITCGKACSAERKRQRHAAWNRMPENKAKTRDRLRKWRLLPENKVKQSASQRKYTQKPEVKARRNRAKLKARRTVEGILKCAAWGRKYRQAHSYKLKLKQKERDRKRRSTPEGKRYRRENDSKRERMRRAASFLGMPPILYVALKGVELHRQSQIQPQENDR